MFTSPDHRPSQRLPCFNHVANNGSRRNLLSQHHYQSCPCRIIRIRLPAGLGPIPRQIVRPGGANDRVGPYLPDSGI